MALFGMYVVFACFAITYAQNCSLSADQFCSLDSTLVECICNNYREQMNQLFTEEICPLVDRIQSITGNMSNVIEIIKTVQVESSAIASRAFDLFCPSVGEFETCVNNNFQTSNKEIDQFIKPYVNNNIGSFAREVCEAADDLRSISECYPNLIVPFMGCGFSTTFFNPVIGLGTTIAQICPWIGDISSCSITQISTICNRQAGSFLSRAISTYLSPSCSNHADGRQRVTGSKVLHCGMTLGSGLLNVIGSVIDMISGRGADVSSIITTVLPAVCQNIERAIGCIAENVDDSTNRYDILVRRMVDIQQLQTQASNIQTAFCSESTRNGILQVVNCATTSSAAAFANCSNTGNSFVRSVLTSTADDNSIRTRICGPFLETSQCISGSLYNCSSDIATLQTELVQGLMRYQECGRTGTGRFAATNENTTDDGNNGTTATKLTSGFSMYLLVLCSLVIKAKLI